MEEEIQAMRNIIEFAESREKVMREKSYPFNMAITDLQSTIARELARVKDPYIEDHD